MMRETLPLHPHKNPISACPECLKWEDEKNARLEEPTIGVHTASSVIKAYEMLLIIRNDQRMYKRICTALHLSDGEYDRIMQRLNWLYTNRKGGET
jgi:hypothetical protein